MSYDIYISDYKKTTILQFPIIPSELPSLSSNAKNEEFETYNDGTYNFIEKEGLIAFSLDSWLPANAAKYAFCKSKVNASDIFAIIENAKKNSEPIFITITNTSGFYVNDSFSIEDFEYNLIQRGDYKYKLGVKQWRDYNTLVPVASSKTVGWNQDSTGWYYYTDTSGNYYKDSWQLIDNEWYSFDAQGYARQSVWLQDGGKWYYLKDSCKMGRNEWLQLSNVWYYFGSDGAMYSSGTFTIDGTSYTFDSSGAWVQ